VEWSGGKKPPCGRGNTFQTRDGKATTYQPHHPKPQLLSSLSVLLVLLRTAVCTYLYVCTFVSTSHRTSLTLAGSAVGRSVRGVGNQSCLPTGNTLTRYPRGLHSWQRLQRKRSLVFMQQGQVRLLCIHHRIPSRCGLSRIETHGHYHMLQPLNYL